MKHNHCVCRTFSMTEIVIINSVVLHCRYIRVLHLSHENLIKYLTSSWVSISGRLTKINSVSNAFKPINFMGEIRTKIQLVDNLKVIQEAVNW